ncbi:MAG: nitrate/nitrite transporter NrtS [Cyanobacteria bacterium J06632_22]
MKGFVLALVDPQYAKKAVQVAAVVGTLLFVINHGSALAQGKMSKGRWLSALLTYGVPYMVSVHGRYDNRHC